MRPIEDIARETGLAGSEHCDCAWPWLERFRAIVRAEALEEAAALCDVMPPYPFRASIEAAHAIRALATDQRDKPRG